MRCPPPLSIVPGFAPYFPSRMQLLATAAGRCGGSHSLCLPLSSSWSCPPFCCCLSPSPWPCYRSWPSLSCNSCTFTRLQVVGVVVFPLILIVLPISTPSRRRLWVPSWCLGHQLFLAVCRPIGHPASRVSKRVHKGCRLMFHQLGEVTRCYLTPRHLLCSLTSHLPGGMGVTLVAENSYQPI